MLPHAVYEVDGGGKEGKGRGEGRERGGRLEGYNVAVCSCAIGNVFQGVDSVL